MPYFLSYLFLFRRGYIYWSDAVSDQLFRSNLDGSNITSLANATHEDVGKHSEVYTPPLDPTILCPLDFVKLGVPDYSACAIPKS